MLFIFLNLPLYPVYCAIKTGLGGKLVLSVELGNKDAVSVKILKA